MLPAQSLDQADLGTRLEQIPADAPDDAQIEQEEFLTRYRDQFLACLDQALQQTMGDRLQVLQRKPDAATLVAQLIQGLHLFHCEGHSQWARSPPG